MAVWPGTSYVVGSVCGDHAVEDCAYCVGVLMCAEHAERARTEPVEVVPLT